MLLSFKEKAVVDDEASEGEPFHRFLGVKMDNLTTSDDKLYKSIISLISEAKKQAVQTVNSQMVIAYWQVGQLIVEDEQQGRQRASYGKQILKTLSKKLTEKLGTGFSLANLKNMRSFYLKFPTLEEKGYTVCSQLSWSHFRSLIRIDNEVAREWYLKEAIACSWSVRTLKRQIDSLFYERLLASSDRSAVIDEAATKVEEITPREMIRDPYVLEFVGLPGSDRFLEADFEQKLIDHLKSFLLELGRGFAFVSRQERICTETKEFFIDLVFYNYRLKCFVLIDLKRGELTHQDIGQMDMYVRMYDELRKDESDNPTVGLILCTGADESVVHFSVLEGNERLFSSRYSLYLPNEEELRAELEMEQRLIDLEESDNE